MKRRSFFGVVGAVIAGAVVSKRAEDAGQEAEISLSAADDLVRFDGFAPGTLWVEGGTFRATAHGFHIDANGYFHTHAINANPNPGNVLLWNTSGGLSLDEGV